MRAVLLLAAILPGCAPTDFNAIGPIGDETAYDRLFPLYAELCALSGVRKYPGFGADISGGPGGHSVLYLNGVCRDGGEHYPVLKMCAAGDAETGVGISANAHFRNANWVATPGRDFFFDGGLQVGEVLDRAAYRRTQQRAQDLGILRGVQFHDRVLADRPPDMSEQDYRYDVSVSTDYAVDFGRGRFCLRMPATPGQMQRMVTFLNAQNARYRDGAVSYDWNVLRDNCAHLTHNALAAAGLWPARPIDRFILIAALTFPVPKNEFVNAVRRANDMDLTDLSALFHDDLVREAVIDGDGPPMRTGALTESEAVWPYNAVYDTGQTLIFYTDPILGQYQPQFEQILTERRYHDARENLQYYAGLYARVSDERKPIEWWLRHDRSLAEQSDAFNLFYSRFYKQIEGAAERVHASFGGA